MTPAAVIGAHPADRRLRVVGQSPGRQGQAAGRSCPVLAEARRIHVRILTGPCITLTEATN